MFRMKQMGQGLLAVAAIAVGSATLHAGDPPVLDALYRPHEAPATIHRLPTQGYAPIEYVHKPRLKYLQPLGHRWEKSPGEPRLYRTSLQTTVIIVENAKPVLADPDATAALNHTPITPTFAD